MVSRRISAVLLAVFIMVNLGIPMVLTPETVSMAYAQSTEEAVNATVTNSTSTTEYVNETATEGEWWQQGPKLIEFSERLVGVCYPWLVMEHFIVHLPTGETYPGTGGDPALAVYCGNNYFIVRGLSGVYVFRKDTGNIFKTVYLNPSTTFIGAYDDTIGIYDSVNNVVYIKNIEGNSDVAVKLAESPLTVSYTIISGIPVVVYSVAKNTTIEYRIAIPGEDKKLEYTGSGAIFVYGKIIYLESDGLKILQITDPFTPTVEEKDYIPLPFKITDMYRIIGDYLIVESYGMLIKININDTSMYYKTYDVIGSAIPTPIGYYVPAAKTTYVIMNNDIYPVPGFAVGVLGNAVFTNVIEKNTTTPILWPIRTTVFVAREKFDGLMYVGDGYVIKIELQPDTYRLPYGAVLKYGSYTLLLDKPEVIYPPEIPTSINIENIASVNFTVADFPKVYVPVDVITGVKSIATGGGKAVLITKDRAIVYGSYGISATIPGTWKFAGAGKCVVLYDGATFRLYDFAGNHIANYKYYITNKPDYITCDFRNGEYVVDVYEGITIYHIKPGKVESEIAEIKHFTDPTGVSVSFGVPYTISYKGFQYPLPLEVRNIHINKFWATWETDNGVSILSIPDATVYTLLNIPENTTFYPLDDNYVIMYNEYEKKVEILAYKSWLVSGCYVDIKTYPDAEVYVNGNPVGKGDVRVYTKCYSSVTLEARKPYYTPARKVVFVEKPVSIELYPKPKIAKVKLEVLAPENLTITEVIMKIDGKQVEWSNGEVKELLAKPYVIEVQEFKPVDVCKHMTFNQTFGEGETTLRIICQLTGSVLALYSKVDTTVKIYRGETKRQFPLTLIFVRGGTTQYVKIDPGTYTLESEPAVEGYTTKTVNVTVPANQIVAVDVTPYAMSKLIVRSNVKTASIIVTDMNGETVASGTGELEQLLLPGTYNIKVSAPGYSPYIDVVKLPAGETVVVNATLTPLPPPPPPPQPPFWQRLEFQVASIAVVAAVALFMLWWRRRKRGVIEVEAEAEAE